jgi:hypothetical protein
MLIRVQILKIHSVLQFLILNFKPQHSLFRKVIEFYDRMYNSSKTWFN